MIPIEIDVVQIIDDLVRMGWKPQKIEIALGYSSGYVAKLRGGPRPERPYQMVARLYNLWCEESANWQTLNSTKT